MWQFHGQFPQYPLWVTEYASTSADEAGEVLSALIHISRRSLALKRLLLVVTDFLDQTTRYMDTLSWIEAYAWFGYFVSPLSCIPFPLH